MANINLDLTITQIFQTDSTIKSYTYRDIGTKNFRVINSDNQEKVINTNTSLYDKESIKNSLVNIFSFIPGEEILDPEFGNSLYQYLYRPIAEEIIPTIKMQLTTLIEKYQPRISIIDIKVETNADENLINLKLYYKIPSLNQLCQIDVVKDGKF